jgi:hypothetical protein
MLQTGEPPAIPRPTWRDNKAVLWLVRIGFHLQFYIPAIICCFVILASYSANNNVIGGYAFFIAFTALVVLVAQWTITTLFLRHATLRTAGIVLGCLIVMNVIHSLVWLCFMSDLPQIPLFRLTPPTVLYMIAIYYIIRSYLLLCFSKSN